MLTGIGGGLFSIWQVQFFKDRMDMIFNGIFGNKKAICNFHVGVTRSNCP